MNKRLGMKKPIYMASYITLCKAGPKELKGRLCCLRIFAAMD